MIEWFSKKILPIAIKDPTKIGKISGALKDIQSWRNEIHLSKDSLIEEFDEKRLYRAVVIFHMAIGSVGMFYLKKKRYL